jgi:hypothetical protein
MKVTELEVSVNVNEEVATSNIRTASSYVIIINRVSHPSHLI